QHPGTLALRHDALHVGGPAGARSDVSGQFGADALDRFAGVAEQVALSVSDAEFDECVEFFDAFDALADDANGAQAAEVDQEADHVLADLVLIDAVDEFAIEFEPTWAERHDAVQPAGAGAHV